MVEFLSKVLSRAAAKMSAALPKHDESLCVRHPVPPLEGFGGLAVPTYRASTIVFETAKNYRERGQRGPNGYSYGLAGTPTTRVWRPR